MRTGMQHRRNLESRGPRCTKATLEYIVAGLVQPELYLRQSPRKVLDFNQLTLFPTPQGQWSVDLLLYYIVMENCRLCSIRKSVFYLIFLVPFVVYYQSNFFRQVLVIRVPKPTLQSGQALPKLESRHSQVHSQVAYSQVGYLMACTIPQQLESAMDDLHQLADMAESWGMKIGEPTVHRSTFRFPLSEKMYHWKLRNIFNISDLNVNFREDFNIDYDLVVSSQEILADKKLGSDVVFIHLTEREGLSSKDCFKLASSTIAKCFQDTPLKDWTQKLMGNVICLRRSNDIDFKALFHKSPILKRVATENTENGSKFIVVFSNWYGVRFPRIPYFSLDSNFHQRNYRYVHAILHSQEVKSAAKELKGALKPNPTFLGIHIRIERLLQRKASITNCIDKLEFNIKKLKGSHLNSSAVAFTDSKPLGTRTCNGRCAKIEERLGIHRRLKSLGVEVNPVLKSSHTSSLRHESGFVANVEQELLSQADFFILVGFGGFQKGITNRYMRYHNMTEQSAEARFIRICPKEQH